MLYMHLTFRFLSVSFRVLCNCIAKTQYFIINTNFLLCPSRETPYLCHYMYYCINQTMATVCMCRKSSWNNDVTVYKSHCCHWLKYHTSFFFLPAMSLSLFEQSFKPHFVSHTGLPCTVQQETSGRYFSSHCRERTPMTDTWNNCTFNNAWM